MKELIGKYSMKISIYHFINQAIKLVVSVTMSALMKKRKGRL